MLLIGNIVIQWKCISPNMIRYLFISWLYLLHDLTDIISQMPCACDTVTLLSSKATYVQHKNHLDVAESGDKGEEVRSFQTPGVSQSKQLVAQIQSFQIIIT